VGWHDGWHMVEAGESCDPLTTKARGVESQKRKLRENTQFSELSELKFGQKMPQTVMYV